MTWKLDARIPLVTVADATALVAVLAEGRPAAVLAEWPAPAMPADVVAMEDFPAAGAAHAAACACCGGRSPAATALDRLFQARVRGSCGWFERVVALAGSEAARSQLAAALRDDAVTAARFRAAD
ncbi:hypothetical protein [Falsiroseomonas sp.]|uniref:hypothetical protein n=1 Tax=Falsiroseomonas sp. TaxID=2870721 RepID=UPI003566B298